MNALVMVGMAEGHWCETEHPRLRAFIPTANELARKAHEAGWLVVLAGSRVRKWHTTGKIWPFGLKVPGGPWHDEPMDISHVPMPPTIHCLCAARGLPGCTPGDARMIDFHEALETEHIDYVLGYRAELQALIQSHGIDKLYYCGAHTAECVGSEPYGYRYMVALMPGQVFFFPEFTLEFHVEPGKVNDYVDRLIVPAVTMAEVFGA